MARPSKYNDSILDSAHTYLETYKEQGDIIPSVVGLALFLDVTPKTLYNWSDDEKNPEFLHMLTKIKSTQEQKLISGGLGGEFNAAITKLVLTKHGYHEKIDTDVTTGGKEIANNFIIQPVTTRVSDE